MAEEWRTLQIFLSSGRRMAVYEVDLELGSRALRCSCPVFRGRGDCAHCAVVRSRMEEDGGYPLVLRQDAPGAALQEALSDRESFRGFVVQFGMVEVL